MASTERDQPGWTKAAWIWLVLVLVLAGLVVLPGLGGGTMRPFDEGLYGKLARNALEHGQYLHAVDAHGAFYEGFEKPPLSIMAVAASFDLWGVSLGSLRLPFALCMLATIGVAFAWGRRIGGVPFAVAWAGVLLTCEATFRWGRVACIEPMLMLFVLTCLWAYHEAMLRRGRAAWAWVVVAALALTLAVATKQVVAGLAVVPLVLLELWRGRGREALPRLGVVLGLPLVAGLAWLQMMAARVGDQAFDIVLGSGVLERMEGYSSGSALRSLNELSGVVAEACEPFDWASGAAGLVVLTLMRPTSRKDADGALLLPLLLLTGVLVFDNLSDSMRPWYAYDLVVPLAGGLGFLVAGVVERGSEPWERTRTIGGVLVLVVGGVAALSEVVSQLDAIALAGVVFVLGWRRPEDARARGRALVVLLAAAVLAFALGIIARPDLRAPPGSHEQMMERLAARGLERVHVDTNTRLDGENAWGTYYGPKASWVGQPPWRTGEEAEAYVSGAVWPLELRPDSGSELLRAPGVTVLVGALGRPPWAVGAAARLLDEGPITFEAEHMPSQREGLVTDDPEASGGLAVAEGGRVFGRPRTPFVLAHGPDLRIGRGDYVAEFVVRVDCGDVVDRAAAAVQVIAGRKSIGEIEVPCGDRGRGYVGYEVEFRTTRAERLQLHVKYMFGEVWFDRVVVRRAR